MQISTAKRLPSTSRGSRGKNVPSKIYKLNNVTDRQTFSKFKIEKRTAIKRAIIPSSIRSNPFANGNNHFFAPILSIAGVNSCASKLHHVLLKLPSLLSSRCVYLIFLHACSNTPFIHFRRF